MSLAERNKMLISEFDYVLLKKDTNMKVVQVVTNKTVCMCKMKFSLDGVLGHNYGSSFKLNNGQLEKLEFKELEEENTEKDDDAEHSEVKDNRTLIDERQNQRLSKEEIQNLRKQGVTGEGIVERLVENSSTFQQKTEFSQQKYLKKKKKKHVTIFTVLRPTTRTLIEMYYSRGPTKICNLRMDSLAQILTQANVRSSSKTLVIETCSGLIIGAILERIAGDGAVVHLYTGSAPSRPALNEGYQFSEKHLQSLYSFPLDQVSTLKRPSEATALDCDKLTAKETNVTTDNIQSVVDNPLAAGDEKLSTEAEQQGSCNDISSADSIGTKFEGSLEKPSSDEMTEEANVKPDEMAKISQVKNTSKSVDNKWKNRKRKFADAEEREKKKAERMAQFQKAKSLIEKADMDGLIVAAKLHPTPIVMSLIDFVSPSRPIVVFSPYKEPLIDCFCKLRERGGVLMVKLTETWFREYQVLTDRTHPTINMSGSGGYLLTATTVAME